MPIATDPDLRGRTVQITRGSLTTLGAIDLVVVDAQPYGIPLEGGGLHPSTLYGLQWPDGTVTWHLRHDFELIGD